MGEDSLHFWIIPIICFIAVGGIFVFVLEYQINTSHPNAVAELDEMKKMSCDEIKSKHELNRYWSKDNGVYGKDKADGCAAVESAIKKLEKDRLDKLLADPNSFESLSRDLKKLENLYDSYSELYEFHNSESKILMQNVTDFENGINRITSQLEREYKFTTKD